KTALALRGSKVVIIGGSSGIGFAAASALIEEGASVIIGSSSAERVASAVKRLSDPSAQYNADPSRVSGYPVNLKGPEAEASLRDFFSKIGAFDHLLYTAGDSLAAKPFHEFAYDDIVSAGSVRLFSVILAVKVATSPGHLKDGGSIVLTTGSVAEKPLKNWSVVAGFASALYGLTRNLALDLSDRKIRVNAVSPGPVETELWDNFPEDHRKAFLASVEAKLLTGRVGQPEDVANAYVYLLKNRNVTAQVIASDGGNAVADRE
ncbi:hypothetical protein, partial [Sporisorium scitamineum]